MTTLATLRARFAGELVTPNHPAYDQRRAIWNRMIDRRPALIARVSSVEDTRLALAHAREQGLPVAIRGGGHNVSGSALVDDGVVIDHSALHGVRLAADGGHVDVEPGVLLGELDAATHRHGLAVPIGINTTTGVAGLALGGGIGWLMRRWGLSADHLVEADLLTAEGRHLTVSETDEPDLLWGLRGGGGNFGIVTRFRFRTRPLPDPVLAGIVLFPLEDGVEVLRRYRDWAADLPRDITTIVALRSVVPIAAMPAELHRRRVVGVALCSVGDPSADDAVRAAVRSFGTVLLDTLDRRPFAAHQALMDSSVPAGNGYYWKSHFLGELSDAAIDVLVATHLEAPQPWSYSLIPRLGGAIGDVPVDATAYHARNAAHALNINGVTDDPADDEAAVAWTRRTFDATAPFSTGGVYVNFMGEEGEERVLAAYGPAYDRLARLKAAWDPDNVFRTNQNIRPAVMAGR